MRKAQTASLNTHRLALPDWLTVEPFPKASHDATKGEELALLIERVGAAIDQRMLAFDPSGT